MAQPQVVDITRLIDEQKIGAFNITVFGPLVGGVLVARQVPLQDMFFIASIPLALGLIAAIVITPLYKAELRRQMALEDNQGQDTWSGGTQLKAET
ncbi:MAG TPA: hypothetical protein VMQ11_09555 [Alphaproteobacteria bacterium]|nr:hypothetical protein [Alphaproteobacteria bacterium]